MVMINRCFSLKNRFGFAWIIAVALGVANPVLADDKNTETVPSTVTADEEITYTEDQVVKQLNYLMANSYKSAQEVIKLEGGVKPYAAGLMDNGEIKTLNLKKDQPVPVDVAIRVLDSAMNSWMKQGLAVATVVYYTSQSADEAQKVDSESADRRMLMINLKHSNGHKIVRMVPYVVQEDGSVGFGEVVEQSNVQ